MLDTSFWHGKRVFLTGHTGFKGSWLSLWLGDMGAIVKGYALKPQTDPNLFEQARIHEILESEYGDIRDLDQLHISVTSFNPDVLIHMAAQPLVRLSYAEPINTYTTNVMGTVNVLEAARSCPNLKAIVNVTTDKCYENKEWVWGYRENEPMGGHDPYSSSKGCSELVTSAYRRSFLQEHGVGVASARAGNVVGGGDWAEDRLIPDILRAFEKNTPVVIRNPAATRPWQHVLEPLSGYLILAQKLYAEPEHYASAWNFGPLDEDAKSVSEILDLMVAQWPDSSWELEKGSNPHEAGHLKLDISKARTYLSWHPTWGLGKTIQKIVQWHHTWLDNGDMHQQCLHEIHQYTKDMSHG